MDIEKDSVIEKGKNKTLTRIESTSKFEYFKNCKYKNRRSNSFTYKWVSKNNQTVAIVSNNNSAKRKLLL